MRMFEEVESRGAKTPVYGSLRYYKYLMLSDTGFKSVLHWLNEPEMGFSKLNLETSFLLANEVLDETL